MHASVYDFVTRVLGPDQVRDKRVLEVGALDVNGSVRPYVTSLRPAEYIGTDRRRGRRVDIQIAAEHLVTEFGCEAFDVVLCLETLEHVVAWRVATFNMLAVLRIGGWFVMTTRSTGFPRHEHPDDHWRFSWPEWSDPTIPWQLVALERDPEAPGMFLCVRKTHQITFTHLDHIKATRAPVLAP